MKRSSNIKLGVQRGGGGRRKGGGVKTKKRTVKHTWPFFVFLFVNDAMNSSVFSSIFLFIASLFAFTFKRVRCTIESRVLVKKEKGKGKEKGEDKENIHNKSP